MNGSASKLDDHIEPGQIRDGYPALSSWISSDPDDEGFIFRRFSRLSARNLLNLQSQLLSLEAEVENLDRESRKIHDVGLRRWETFEEQMKDPTNTHAQNKKRIYEDLESKIKKYHEALELQAKISSLHRPRARVLAEFQEWFHGGHTSIVNGRAMSLLDQPEDLVALRAPTDEDALSRFLQNHWPFPGRQSDAVSHFQERHVMKVVSVINVLTASALLIGAIVSLYIVKESVSRLVMITVFTALFATSVALMTNARRAEVFAATAAYSAVLVVFVSGTLG